MNESKQTLLLKAAYSKGYRVNAEGQVISHNGKFLSLSGTSDGYLSFNMRFQEGNPTRVFVHRLHAYQKFGDALFEEGILVRHLNGNSLDNSFDNIAIGTNSDNMLDKSELVRKLGSSSPKHNHEEVIKDRNSGMTYAAIMKKHSISSRGTISFIINSSLKKQGVK